MGDLKVIAPPDRNTLHRADSGGMKFMLKAPLPGLGPVVTFTAKHEPFMELYKIIIGRQTKIINMTTEDHDVSVYNLDNLDIQPRQEFWITWFSKKIRMGIPQHRSPFLVYDIDTEHEIGYIQFNTMTRNWAPVEWVIETSPVKLEILPYKTFESDLRWLPLQRGKVPPGAMIGGFEHEPIYIARASHNDSLCPGKYLPLTGLAYVPWGRREHIKTEFEILCGSNAKWVKSQTNFIPHNAFVAGRSEVSNDPLYVGRAMIGTKLIPGKVHVHYKSCYVPFHGREVEVTSYEILTVPDNYIPQAIPFGLSQQFTPSQTDERSMLYLT